MRKSLIMSIFLTLLNAAPAMAEPMTAADIQAKIIGQTFDARRGVMRAKMTCGSDGSVTLKTPLFTDGGTWRLAGNQLCMNITKPALSHAPFVQPVSSFADETKVCNAGCRRSIRPLN